MEEDNAHGWITTILIIVTVWALFFHKQKYEGQTAEEWFNSYDYEVAISEGLESKLSDYQDALQEANDNIEEANSNIEDAKGYAWESYEEMGDALDYLDTVDTVYEP